MFMETQRQTAGTEKACYVCYKPTTTVLATINTVDFLYTCPGHLEDRGFASKLGGVDGAGGGRKMGLSDEEIAKVKEEWEQKQKAKVEKEKEKKEQEKKEKEKKEGDEGDSKDKKEKEKETKRDESKSPKMPGSLSTSTPPTPTHERYALHRDYFASKLEDFCVPIRC